MAPKGSAEDCAGELEALRKEVEKLRAENTRLSGQAHVLKEGQLSRFRETTLSSNWRKRFFDLRLANDGSATLRCFDQCQSGPQQQGQRGAPKMTIQLSSEVEICSECKAAKQVPGEPPHCLQLKFPDKSAPIKLLRLGSESEEEVQAWLAAFEAACASVEAARHSEKSRRLLTRAPTKQVTAEAPQLTKTVDTSALRPVHIKLRDSVLTAEEGGGIPECNVVGILNLCVTVMVVVHIRLVVDNLMKYGLLLSAFGVDASTPISGFGECALCCLGLPALGLLAVLVERWASSGALADQAANMAHGFLCVLSLAVPVAVIRDTKAAPPIGMVLLLAACVLFLKLASYAHVNAVLRQQTRDKKGDQKGSEANDKDKLAYPASVTAWNMLEFLAFPTLVYQTSYPRTAAIRKRWVAKRVGELVLCLVVMKIIIEQFVVPTLKNSTVPFQSYDLLRIFAAIMKLSLPNVYVWLFMFYGLFHLWLNILAELTFFGDRLFYKEWWNATKLEDYWRLWNLPVHNWLVKHVFLPILNAGYKKNTAIVATFFVSAVFHELLVSVPCHTFRLWAFLGMMAQLPLVNITAWIDKRLKGSQLGNVIFWISFCIVGQPLCVLLYFSNA